MLAEMPNAGSIRSGRASPRFVLLLLIAALALALRLLHLSSEMQSPLSYQPGPDEGYYRQFGEAVAAGHGQSSPAFTFMDPGYGYLLGGFFALFGANLFVVYLAQILLDTATACGIYVIGRLLGRPRAGILGALLYALTSTAIMFAVSLLKETWVTAYLTWWIVGCLVLLRGGRKWNWLAFGAYCGFGVALRSTLVSMDAFALALPFLRVASQPGAAPGKTTRAALLACGMLIGLVPMSLRNYEATGSASPFPFNGGIVLHQLYNDHNPRSVMWIPEFVSYYDPEEILRGYSAEASRREHRQLSSMEVDRYWRDAALTYIAHNGATVLGAVLRKAGAFLSATEIPSNRSSAEERLFSPVLRILPAPATWLLAMGLSGLVLLSLEDRRWAVVAAPICLAWLTFAFFWAEDRFRVHAMSALAFCSGYFLDRMAQLVTGRDYPRWIAGALFASTVAAASLLVGARMPPPPLHWDHVIWGYVRMGRIADARALAQNVLRRQPENESAIEALGVTAAAAHHYPEAEEYLERAIALRPRSHIAHYDLARVYLAEGNWSRAEQEARVAVTLEPAADYRALLSEIENLRGAR